MSILRIPLLALALLSSWLVALASFDGPEAPRLRVLISELRPGKMSSEQRCLLVFEDHSFHHELAIRKRGRDLDRRVYTGKLSDSDWDALTSIVDRDDFRSLRPSATVPPLVIPDLHAVTIDVARGGSFQNLEFLTDKSRRPYDGQIKPLFRWWKAVTGGTMALGGTPDKRCTLANSRAVVAQ